MYPGSVVLQAILLVAGIWWCKVILGRWRDDVAELKAVENATKKGVIVSLWLVTLGIAILVVNSVWGIVESVIGVLR